jgi:hypothetical protein
MKVSTNLVRIGIVVSLAVSCGKSPSKNEGEQNPRPSSTDQEEYKPLKAVEKTAYPFTLSKGESSCEEFKRRLEGKTWGFNLEVTKYKDIKQEEEAQFAVNKILCQPGEDTLTFLAKSAESKGFSVSFNMKFSGAEGVLNYQLDDCYTTSISRLIDSMPLSDKPTTEIETLKVRKSINDNYCVPAVDKLAEMIVSDLSL